MQETQEIWVLSLGWKDLLEKEMGTHSGILDWRNPWTAEPGGLQSMGSQRVRHDYLSPLPIVGHMTHVWTFREFQFLPPCDNDRLSQKSQ